MSIHDQVNMVQTRDDFVQFVRVLARTATKNPEWWANRDLSQYIESLGAWVEDMDDYVAGIGEPVFEQPSWRLLARCLIAAAIYE